MSIILVADIGGTNGRFGLVNACNHEKGYLAERQISLPSGEYATLADMIRDYIKQADVAMPKFACLAIAGPIQDGHVKVTNLNWEFSISQLRDELNMQALDVINDYSALAYAAPHLQPEDIKTLYNTAANPYGPIGVMGPGTGFGAALLAPISSGWKIIATEGGHCSFAPTNATEISILQELRKEFEHVSIEHLLSGQGLVHIYRSLASIEGISASDLSPADISGQGMSQTDPLCERALQIFCNVLGSVAGDKALSWGAMGGIYLGGGIVPKIADYLPHTDFIQRYHNKGVMRDYVESIPVHMVINDKAALIGSAAWLVDTVPALQS
ncbi:glucokinase [Gilvimarinus agarilyticus]|uniref:glucokinase n=1 Tax=unclassified Gilvimarinus TaxID=2642066 RepID=UPI001C09A85B|nr:MULTISPECIES: glucokinase [unclassified Gilvimarinus]MBU2886130.1 glucokinase [Gilvimarinus agarilyticus]MDO6570840.1 glucokinase [Gilvimarinus sp. 2_MG-2023]MDO6747008.1 glucokinase [Gilvimarinus sp. 1_MG-2023]